MGIIAGRRLIASRGAPVWLGFGERASRALDRVSLARQFLLVNLVILAVGSIAVAWWTGEQIARGVLHRTAAITALYVESFVEPYLTSLATQPRLAAADMAALDRLVAETPLGQRIVAFKVWSPGGEVLYSPNRTLLGRTFPEKDELARALRGEVVADVSDLSQPENEAERKQWPRLVEVYVPVRERGTSRILGVTEFYQLPDELEAEVRSARLRSWAVVAAGALASYAVLAGLVKRGSDTITRQQAALREQVVTLSLLLDQNARLTERVRQAAGRTTALNEQALRRVSADLHDGPGQALALAMLRLDALGDEIASSPRASNAAEADASTDFATVRGAVRDALAELRTISAGLRSPELAALTVADVAQRAVRDHERRTGAPVRVDVGAVPDRAPLPVKIALFRSIQETLSNAARHATGAPVAVRVWGEAGTLCLDVADEGPGILQHRVAAGGAHGGLGLVGLRERAELLGGTFRVDSRRGAGTTVHLCWPLAEEAVT